MMDVGTTTIKVGVFLEDATLLRQVSDQNTPISGSPGESTVDFNESWSSVLRLCKLVLSGSSPDEIKAVSYTGNRVAVSFLGRNDQILCPAMTWMDSRTSSSFEERIEEFDKRILLQKILWLRDNNKDLFNQTKKVLSLDAFLSKRLTGRELIGTHTAVYALYDWRRRIWDKRLGELQVPDSILPEVAEPGETIGPISADVASELNLHDRTPVIMGVGDNQASTLAVGALARGDTKIGLSTGAYVDVVLDELPYDFYNRGTRTFCHPYFDGKVLFEGVVPGTGMAYRWFGENFVPSFNQASAKGEDPFIEAERMARNSPRGSEGVLMMPLFMFKRGIFWGLSYSNNSSHFLRSIIEGTGFGLKMFFDMALALGANPELIRMDGSGAKSDLWREVVCDILEKPALAMRNPDASALIGTAMMMRNSLGLSTDLKNVRRDWLARHEPKMDGFYHEPYERFLSRFLAEVAESNI